MTCVKPRSNMMGSHGCMDGKYLPAVGVLASASAHIYSVEQQLSKHFCLVEPPATLTVRLTDVYSSRGRELNLPRTAFNVLKIAAGVVLGRRLEPHNVAFSDTQDAPAVLLLVRFMVSRTQYRVV